jgi:hypothetical protein
VSSAQRVAVVTVSFLVMAVAISALALRGYNPWVAVIGGVWWGLVPVGLLFGILNAAAPGRIIRWRKSATAGQTGYQKLGGQWFSKWMAIAGPQPWENHIARDRVRILGICQVLVSLLVGAALLLLPVGR